MKHSPALVALVLVMVAVFGCDSARRPPSAATATPQAGVPAATDDRQPSGGPVVPGALPGDAYAYRPQLAYIDLDGTAWLVDATGANRLKLIEGCTGIGSAKRGAVLNGGLVWSPEGGRIACWRDDRSVLAAQADGSERTMPFQPGECDAAPRWAAGGRLIACDVNGYVSVREPGGRQRVAVKNDILEEWSWSPSGQALIVAIPPPADRLAWGVVDRDGRMLAQIDDAYVGSAAQLRWTRDGRSIAYPGASGITVLDIHTTQRQFFQPPPESGLELGGGGQVDWILGDSAVFVHNYSGAAAIDVGSGAVKPLPQASYGVARVAPDGVQVALVIPDGSDQPDRQRVAVANLRAGTVEPIAGSSFTVEGIGLPAEFVFSGDSGRVCWTPRPGNVPAVQCAAAAGAATKVSAPVQVEPDVLGRGDPAVLWRSFSPDLAKIAYGTPGLESPAAPQRLYIANPDGAVVADLGSMLGTLTYSWRPDGVYRPAQRR